MLVEGGRGSSSSMWQALTSVPRVRAGANPAAASPAAASVLPTPPLPTPPLSPPRCEDEGGAPLSNPGDPPPPRGVVAKERDGVSFPPIALCICVFVCVCVSVCLCVVFVCALSSSCLVCTPSRLCVCRVGTPPAR